MEWSSRAPAPAMDAHVLRCTEVSQQSDVMGQTATSQYDCVMAASLPKGDIRLRRNICRNGPILLQKSQNECDHFFRQTTEQAAIAN